MPLELAHRLVSSLALPSRVVEAALLRHAKERIPFVTALLELYPEHARELAQELDFAGGAAVDDIAPDPHLMARVPVGLCSRLLAFPIGITSSSGVVDVLVVDPLDGHVAAEFGYHLHTRVRLVRGRVRHIIDELAGAEGVLGPRTARQDQLHMNEPEVHSAPPIPLTRLALEGDAQPGTTRGVAPPAAVAMIGIPPVPPPSEAMLGAAQEASSGEDSVRARISLFAPASDDLQAALSELAVSEDPDTVVDALIQGLAKIAREIVVFAVRGDKFRSRGRTDLLSQPRRDASIELGTGPHTLSQALEFGQYLGPLATDSPELRFLSQHYDEVCATRVDVMNRPALVLFAAGFHSAYDVSLRSDHLARAASDALARIVLAKKR